MLFIVGEDGKFSGGTLSDPSLTINNIAKSDEGTYACIVKHRFGTTTSEDSVLTCKEKPSIHITSTNADVVEGQIHTITCSISSISDITGITWIKRSATGDTITIVVCEDGKFSGGTLSDPSLTINNITRSNTKLPKLPCKLSLVKLLGSCRPLYSTRPLHLKVNFN